MELVAAGFQDDVNYAAGVASAFRGRLRLCGKFVNCVQGHDDASDAGDAALVDGGNVVPEVVVVDAVNLPVHLVGAGTVQRTETADRVAAVAGLNRGELREVAPVHWYILNRLGGNDVVLRRSCGIES